MTLATGIAEGHAISGSIDLALDVLYQAVRCRLTEGRLEEVRELLLDAKERAALPPSAFLALLTLTRGRKTEFATERLALVHAVEQRVPDRAPRLLRGLT